MTMLDVLGLLLAISVSLNLGFIAVFLKTQTGADLPTALLYGAGVVAGTLALIIAAIGVYR